MANIIHRVAIVTNHHRHQIVMTKVNPHHPIATDIRARRPLDTRVPAPVERDLGRRAMTDIAPRKGL